MKQISVRKTHTQRLSENEWRRSTERNDNFIHKRKYQEKWKKTNLLKQKK